MQEVLKKKNYDFVYREYPEGHTWGNWRRHLIDALIHFFGKEQ
jgi:enterochelin esterase-like enzyme